jgi:O-antigen chain-terminating methyltransferase
MEDIFEIRGGEIDTDEMVERIKANIQKRKASGAYTEEDKLKIDKADLVQDEPQDLSGDFSDLNNLWNISYNYTISSHRKIAGAVLIKGRQVVNSEVKRYVDPVIEKQKEFNLQVVHDFTSLNNRLDSKIDIICQSLIPQLSEELERKLNERLERKLNERLERKLNERLMMMADDIHKKAWLASLLENKVGAANADVHTSKAKNPLSIDYQHFSEEISKSWLEIGGLPPNNPNVFDDAIAIFNGMDNVLDIGCGSGYFLEMLKARGISSYGIDIDDDYVEFCRKSGLNVIEEDAISHLRSLDDNTLGGIFISQVIEHLSIEEVDDLVRLCHKKMRSGASLVIVTPNILSMLVSANLFYMDPTHVTHVHPDVLKFLLKSRGFDKVEDRFYQQVQECNKLKRITVDDRVNPELKPVVDSINANIDMLNRILYGYRDYAAIAMKG